MALKSPAPTSPNSSMRKQKSLLEDENTRLKDSLTAAIEAELRARREASQVPNLLEEISKLQNLLREARTVLADQEEKQDTSDITSWGSIMSIFTCSQRPSGKT